MGSSPIVRIMDKDNELKILEENLPRLIRATLNFMWLVQNAKERGAVSAIDPFRAERDYHKSLCEVIKGKLHDEGRVNTKVIDWNSLYRLEYLDSGAEKLWNGSKPDIDA